MRFVIALCGVLMAPSLGCSRSSSPQSTTPGTDAAAPSGEAGVDAGVDASADGSTCFTNPQTYLEIINACTDAEAIDKTDNLSPMNLSDGGLQPLP